METDRWQNWWQRKESGAGEGKKDKVLFVWEGPRRAAAAGGLTEGQEIEKTLRAPPLKVG